jgi:hypothetical protein
MTLIQNKTGCHLNSGHIKIFFREKAQGETRLVKTSVKTVKISKCNFLENRKCLKFYEKNMFYKIRLFLKELIYIYIYIYIMGRSKVVKCVPG